MNKKVSIILPVHNGLPYIKDAVESISGQTYKNWELIIIDDYSNDESFKFLNKLKDKRIKIIRNKKKLGVAQSLNIAIKKATGEYIARMDSDDISMPDRIKKQANFLDKNSNIDLCGSAVYLINEAGLIIGTRAYSSDDKQIKKDLPYHNAIIHPTFMGRKRYFVESGGYNKEYEGAEDYELLLRTMSDHTFANLNQKLLKLRLNPQNVSRTNLKTMDKMDLKLKVNLFNKTKNPLMILLIIRKIFATYLLPPNLKIKIASYLKRI